jgi:Initiation factor 2 subunit family
MSSGAPSNPHLKSLRSRLAEVARDRAASARQVVQETSGILEQWLLELPGESPLCGAELELELAEWAEEQAWRGPCARWLDSCRLAWWEADGSGRPALRALVEEVAIWRGEEARFPSRDSLAALAAGELDRGEVVLVTAWSETVALAVESAWRLGKRPEVLLGEGLPGLDGRRMARRLARAGVSVTMAYDAALPSLVPRADRLWLSTEAIGAGAFLARCGTRNLLEECSRRDVPAAILATSDKLVPGGDLRLPAWCERETWPLWEDAPEGVRLESQCFESVPLELAGIFLTEVGTETASALHLRALRVEAAPPCGAPSSMQPAAAR